MKIYEIPLIVQDCALFDFKKYTSDRALNESLKLVEITEDVQGLICFLWHPGTYDGRKWKKWLRVYDSLLRHLVKKNAYISTANEVVAYWQERRSNLLG